MLASPFAFYLSIKFQIKWNLPFWLKANMTLFVCQAYPVSSIRSGNARGMETSTVCSVATSPSLDCLPLTMVVTRAWLAYVPVDCDVRVSVVHPVLGGPSLVTFVGYSTPYQPHFVSTIPIQAPRPLRCYYYPCMRRVVTWCRHCQLPLCWYHTRERLRCYAHCCGRCIVAYH